MVLTYNNKIQVETPPKTMEDLVNVFARHRGVAAVMLMTRQGNLN